MSLTQFPCQYCGKTQSVPSSRNGQSLLCRNCGGDNLVPGVPPVVAAPEPRNQAPLHQADAEHTTCPYCGEVIKAAAIKCRHCGERLESGRQQVAAGQAFGGPVGGGPQQNLGPADRFGPRGGQQGYHGQGPGGPQGAVYPDLNNAANTSILIALLGIFFCWGLPSPFALIKANEAKALSRQYGVPVPVQATIAVVIAWMVIIGWAGMIGLFGLAIVMGA